MISFESFWNQFSSFSLLTKDKALYLYNELANIPDKGAIAEIGVYKGYTAKMMRLMYPNCNLYLYDTFSGIVKADNHDCHKDGDFSDTSLESVKKLIGNADYKVGMFPETFSESSIKFSFVHSDTDTYFGTKESILKFKDLIINGGKIVFDDYEWIMCPGVKEAIDEFKKTDDAKEWRFREYVNQFVMEKR